MTDCRKCEVVTGIDDHSWLAIAGGITGCGAASITTKVLRPAPFPFVPGYDLVGVGEGSPGGVGAVFDHLGGASVARSYRLLNRTGTPHRAWRPR